LEEKPGVPAATLFLVHASPSRRQSPEPEVDGENTYKIAAIPELAESQTWFSWKMIDSKDLTSSSLDMVYNRKI
jgi:hypothetical protein